MRVDPFRFNSHRVGRKQNTRRGAWNGHRRRLATRRLCLESLETRCLLAAATTVVYQEDFESGSGGYTADNNGGTVPGLWHYSVGRRADGLTNHTPTHSWYYGAFETSTGGGHYYTHTSNQGVLISPEIALPECVSATTLSFHYLLDTRPDLTSDLIEVQIDDGTSLTTVLTRAGGGLPETGTGWGTAAVDLSAFAGDQVRVRFSFQAVGPAPVDPEGWYIDDVVVTAVPKAVCGYKWDDVNHDGQWDKGEPGLNDWRVYVDLDDDGQWDHGQPGVVDEPSSVTQNDGKHDGSVSFDELPSGTYMLREVLPRGWHQSYPGAPDFGHAVTILPGQSVVGHWERTELPNFGNFFRLADLEVISKADTPDPVAAGALLTYTISLVNHGPNDAQTVTVTDVIPEHTTFLSAEVIAGVDWTIDAPPVGGAGQVVFSKGTVAAAETATFQIVVRVDPDTPGGATIHNTVTAASPTDPDTTNNEKTATTTVRTRGDLEVISKADTPDPVAAGAPLTYTISLVNHGPSDAQTVTVTDVIPEHTTYMSAAMIAGVGWTIDAPPVGGTGQVVFSKGTVAAAETATFQIVVRVDPNTPDDATIHNTVTAASPTDPDTTNNEKTADTTVRTRGDLEVISKADTPDPVAAGAPLTYTISLVNHGPSDAQTVTVTDVIPEHTTYMSAAMIAGVGWTIDAPPVGGTGQVVFSKGMVAAAETATFQIAVRVNANTPDGATIRNTATAASPTDPDKTNNAKTADTMVQTRADLAIDKRDDDSDAVAGTNFTYIIAVTNYGPSDSTGAWIRDLLPSGWRLAPSDNPTCRGDANDPQTVTCTIGRLTAGSTTVFAITAVVPTDALPETVTNCAELMANETDLNAGNNQDCEPTDVVRHTDLSIDKWDDGSNAAAGTNYTYMVEVTNLGPSDSTGAAVTDTLPVGWTFVSSSNSTCAGHTNDPQTVACTVGPLPVGAKASCTITAAVPPDAVPGTAMNWAEVQSNEADPNTGNNRDSESTTVGQAAVIQFITPLSVFRPNGPSAPESPDPGVEVSIRGFQWHDLDQDGVWDADEPGRAGWTIYLDLNDDNVFDAQNEPFAITGSDGSYTFGDLVPGTYTVREDRFGLSDGSFEVQPFPAADPTGARDPDEHVVVLTAGQAVVGRFGIAEAPNFGTLDYSPFIRPADDYFGHLDSNFDGTIDLNEISTSVSLLTALSPWQTFQVANTTGAAFEIERIEKHVDTSRIAVADQFVRVLMKDADGKWVPPRYPIRVPSGETAEFLAFYDPAVRVDGNSPRDTVEQQYPDWYDDPDTLLDESKTRPAHTFSRDDHLTVITTFLDDSEGPTFRIDVVGSSTYDSDIFYEGAVDRLDASRLGDLLALKTIEDGLLLSDSHPLFDPTSDINARCPNGAGGYVDTCSWSLTGSPQREIGLGDLGPLNVEWDRARAPFLDLDADNDSGAKGADYVTEFTGTPVAIADFDAQFANSVARVIQRLSVTAESGDELQIDETQLPPNITATFPQPHGLELSGAGTVEQYAQALQLVRYSTRVLPTTTRTARIEVVAVGNPAAGKNLSFTKLMDDSELESNVAVASVIIQPAVAAGVTLRTTNPQVEEGEAADESLAGNSQDSARTGSTAPGSWHNSTIPCDVNGRDGVTPLDALIIVNYLNDHPGDTLLPDIRAAGSFFYDVNNDGWRTPRDAMVVINFLDSLTRASPEGESFGLPLQDGSDETTAEPSSTAAAAVTGEFGGARNRSEPDANEGVGVQNDALGLCVGASFPAPNSSVPGDKANSIRPVPELVWDDRLLRELEDAVLSVDAMLPEIADSIAGASV